MQLVERGILDLDETVTTYLPYFKLKDERFRKITVRMLLGHMSGMPDIDEDEYSTLMENPETDDGALERYVRALDKLELRTEPGTKLYYSNPGYSILGEIIAKKTGMVFETYLKEHLLKPIGMKDSTFLLSDVPKNRLAIPHLRTPEMQVNANYPNHRGDSPASSLHSTLNDMLTFGEFLINKGTVHGKQIVSATSLDLLWTGVAPRRPPPFYEEMGLGWMLGHFQGQKVVSHGGMGFGWTDFFMFFPGLNMAAVMMSNDESYSRKQINNALASEITGYDYAAGDVSWTISLCEAYLQGGYDAVTKTAMELFAKPPKGISVDQDELINLVYNMVCARKHEQAVFFLKLYLQFYPNDPDAAAMLARESALQSLRR
jgi:CubicO group peptidase (beta-lactamase class C family)